MGNTDPALAILRRRARLFIPGMLFALLFGGTALYAAFYHAVARDVPELFSALASPYATALMAVAAAGCVALAVRASRAEDRLFALEVRQAREIRREVLASRRGEEFARRWSAGPPVANRLRELREERDVSPAELAEVLWVTEHTLSLIERQSYEPGLKVALLASEYLGEPVEEVFRVGEGWPSPAHPSRLDAEAGRERPQGAR